MIRELLFLSFRSAIVCLKIKKKTVGQIVWCPRLYTRLSLSKLDFHVKWPSEQISKFKSNNQTDLLLAFLTLFLPAPGEISPLIVYHVTTTSSNSVKQIFQIMQRYTKDLPGFWVALRKTSDISWICVFVHGTQPLCTMDSYSDNFES